MDAVKFLEEVKKMCESQTICVEDNKACPIVCYRNGYCIGSALKTVETDDFSNIVNIVEQWSRKTRSSEFLKCYPNATIGRHGVIDICPKAIDKNYTPANGCSNTSCDECSYKYWMQEVEVLSVLIELMKCILAMMERHGFTESLPIAMGKYALISMLTLWVAVERLPMRMGAMQIRR